MEPDKELNESEQMTCELCGEKFALEDNEGRVFHVITRHPLEAIQTKSFITAVTSVSYALGEKLANRIFK